MTPLDSKDALIARIIISNCHRLVSISYLWGKGVTTTDQDPQKFFDYPRGL